MAAAFTPEAARATRRSRLVGRAAAARGRGPRRRRMADARRGDLALQPDRRARPRRVPSGRPAEVGEPGPEPAPGGGPVAAEAGERAGLVVVRNGRVVHHELDDRLAAKGVVVCGLATCDETTSRRCSARARTRHPTRSPSLHDAFLAGGAFLRVPAGVVVEKPIVVLHWSDGDGLASFPHTLVVAEESSEVTVLDRFGSPDPGGQAPRRRRRRADRRRQRPRAVPLGAGARPAHVADRTAACARRRDASLRSSAVALGGDYARLRSESLLTGEGAESDLLAVYFGDHEQMLDFRTLQDHDAPHTRSDLLFKGAVEDEARSVYSGLIRLRPRRRRRWPPRRTATSC